MPTASITISGIPCEVTFEIHPAEPDVGIFRPYIEELQIIAINGRKVKKPSHAAWLYDKLNASRETFDRACEEAYAEYRANYDF